MSRIVFAGHSAIAILVLALAAVAPLAAQSPFASVKWRSIGPVNTSGRIDDIAVARVKGSADAIYIATANKSNSAYAAIDAALADVRAGRTLPVPKHLRDASYQGAQRLGHGEGYEYSHAHPGHFVPQDFTLTLSKTGNGDTFPQQGVQGYVSGRTAVLSATPAAGNYFSGWTGAPSSYGATPVAQVLMPHRIPLGFHACWMAADRMKA